MSSNCDMSEMMTLSPTERPFLTSIVFTEARPSCNGDAARFALAFVDLEDSDRALGLAEAWAADEQHVRQSLDLDRAVDREVGARTRRQRVVDRDFHRDRALNR